MTNLILILTFESFVLPELRSALQFREIEDVHQLEIEVSEFILHIRNSTETESKGAPKMEKSPS